MKTITTIKGSRNHLKNCCTSLFVGGGELENPEKNHWYKVRTDSKLKPHDNSPHCCEVSVLTTASSTLFSYNQVNCYASKTNQVTNQKKEFATWWRLWNCIFDSRKQHCKIKNVFLIFHVNHYLWTNTSHWWISSNWNYSRVKMKVHLSCYIRFVSKWQQKFQEKFACNKNKTTFTKVHVLNNAWHYILKTTSITPAWQRLNSSDTRVVIYKTFSLEMST